MVDLLAIIKRYPVCEIWGIWKKNVIIYYIDKVMAKSNLFTVSMSFLENFKSSFFIMRSDWKKILSPRLSKKQDSNLILII